MMFTTATPRRRKKPSFLVVITVSTILIFYATFYVFPIFYALMGSFYKWNPLIDQMDYVGLINFTEVIQDPILWISVGNTLYLTFAILILRTFIALFLAIIICSLSRMKSFFRTALFTPMITSLVACSIMWKWIYAPNSGLLNSFLNIFGIPGQRWLQTPALVLPSIIIMTVWKDLGFPLVVFIAGISSIPGSFYEVPYLEGASRWQVVKYVIFPLLRPTMLFVLVTGIISYLQIITQVIAMTKPAGGPGYSSYTMAYFLYDAAFKQYKFGYASAIAFVILAFIILFTAIQFKVLKTDWRY